MALIFTMRLNSDTVVEVGLHSIYRDKRVRSSNGYEVDEKGLIFKNFSEFSVISAAKDFEVMRRRLK